MTWQLERKPSLVRVDSRVHYGYRPEGCARAIKERRDRDPRFREAMKIDPCITSPRGTRVRTANEYPIDKPTTLAPRSARSQFCLFTTQSPPQSLVLLGAPTTGHGPNDNPEYAYVVSSKSGKIAHRFLQHNSSAAYSPVKN